jgi:hypothetical protein
MFFRFKSVRGVDYLQIVENVRVAGQPRQFVRLSLGRVEELKKTGFFDRLLENAASLSNAGIFLSPGAEKGAVRISRDENLYGHMLAQMLTASGLRDTAHALARKSGFPGVFRRLLIETLFALADQPPIGQRRVATLRALTARSSECHDTVTSKLLLERSLSRELTETKSKDLVLSLRVVGRTETYPSLARGLVLAVVITPSGAPVSFEHCPAFWPVPELAATLTNRLKHKFGCRRVIVLGERGMINPRVLAALQEAGLSYIFPVHENMTLESALVDPTELECHEISSPSEFREGIAKPRFIRLMHPRTAENDGFLRHLQLKRLDNKGSIFEAPPRLTTMARRRLEAAAGWDGASVLATNLPDSPQSLGALFCVSQDSRSWGHELTHFGVRSFAFDGIPRDPDDVLQGWSTIALLAHSLRHFLLLQLRERSGRSVSWTAVQGALRDSQRMRVTRGQCSILLNPELDTLMAHTFAALNIEHPKVVESGASDSGDESI